MHSSITKRVISLALLVVATIPVAVAAQSNVKQITVHTGINIRVDGQLTQMTDANGHPVEVFEYNGTTYVPLRGVAQSMGADISYDAGTRTASVNSPASTGINPLMRLSINCIVPQTRCTKTAAACSPSA